MLNPFPQLLTFSFFAPTLLRAVSACVLFFVAGRILQKASVLATIPFPLVGKTNPRVLQVAAGITALVGVALLVGYATQWAAILGILIALKLMWFRKKLEPILLFQNSTYALLLAICFSLLLTGAGALAFDLPL